MPTDMKARALMLDIVKDLRADKRRYAKFKTKISKLKTDEERAEALLDFVIKDERVGQVFQQPGSDVALGTTTVTVTTVIIIVPSAY